MAGRENIHENIIIKKADALCPDSLDMIGVYGSVATGDKYEKSDLDLMIRINDENGRVLADGFVIDDVDIGYDIYCTSWDVLEKDACRGISRTIFVRSKKLCRSGCSF